MKENSPEIYCIGSENVFHIPEVERDRYDVALPEEDEGYRNIISDVESIGEYDLESWKEKKLPRRSEFGKVGRYQCSGR